MAHVQKYTKGNVQGLSIHWDRKTENHSNQDIDNERSHLNYDLCEKEGDTLSRMNDRLNEVHCLNRKDVKVCADWVVTLPESLKDTSEKEQREFFEKTYEFLANRYGGEKNVLSANVHNDETRPHIHFAFIPVVWDEKKLREKVSAKEVLTRKELKTFHQDLDKFLKKEIPYIYKEGILN
ncbi:MobV family relaxase, partial [Bacillus thuringiensis]